MTMRSTIRNVAARTATVGARRRDAYEEMQRRARLANDVRNSAPATRPQLRSV
jgi:hypothetical protein